MRLNRPDTVALLAELRQTEWHTGRWPVRVDHLWLMQRGPRDAAWRYIQRLELRGAAVTP
jgi:hypothetical protein